MSPEAEQLADLRCWYRILWASTEACERGLERYQRYLADEQARWERAMDWREGQK